VSRSSRRSRSLARSPWPTSGTGQCPVVVPPASFERGRTRRSHGVTQ
jgi:hypothetical protein